METEVMSKVDLVNIIENAELSKKSSNYKMKFWMVVVTPLLVKLGYPIFDSGRSVFNENLLSIEFDVEGKAKEDDLKVVYSLSSLKDLQKADDLDGVDYVVELSTEDNSLKFYTYGMGEYHILNEFNLKDVGDDKYNRFFRFLNYQSLCTMYTKHGKKLVTSSLLDRMFKVEPLSSNLFVQQALKDLFQSPPEELYRLISEYLFANYTFKSPTNIVKDLKGSEGTLLDAFNNIDSGGYTSIFDDSVTKTSKRQRGKKSEDVEEDYTDTTDFGFDYNSQDKDIKNVADISATNNEDLDDKDTDEHYESTQSKNSATKDAEKSLDVTEDVAEDNKGILESLNKLKSNENKVDDDLDDDTDDFAVGVYPDGLSGGLDSLLDDDDEPVKPERNIAKRTNNLNDILKL